MSTIKVEEIQHPSNSNNAVSIASDSSVSLKHSGSAKLATTSTGVSVTGTCAATTLSGSLASSNLTGALPAIDGSNLTNVGGGSLEFVKKIEPSSAVSSIVETGLDYDRVYRLVFNLNLSGNGGIRLSPHVDNSSSPHNNSDCNQGYTNANGNGGQTGQNHWNMYAALDRIYISAIWELYTGDRAWMFWRYNNWNASTDYTGWIHGYGWKVVASNTNNDSNQTGSFAKVNGFTIQDIYGNNINPGTKLSIYKYKES